jgi:hypothetical protein
VKQSACVPVEKVEMAVWTLASCKPGCVQIIRLFVWNEQRMCTSAHYNVFVVHHTIVSHLYWPDALPDAQPSTSSVGLPGRAHDNFNYILGINVLL